MNDYLELLENPIPDAWETLRRSVSSKAGRHAVIAGGAIRDHLLGIPFKDIDIFVLGMTAQTAKEIFDAAIIEYAGVEEAKHQYTTADGLTIDLVFSQYDNVPEVLAHFDLGICRIAWDGNTLLGTEDFGRDLTAKTVTQFYPSPSGHTDRVMAKLGPLGFTLIPRTEQDAQKVYENYVRKVAEERGYRLMHRRKGKYWLMRAQPMALNQIAEQVGA